MANTVVMLCREKATLVTPASLLHALLDSPVIKETLWAHAAALRRLGDGLLLHYLDGHARAPGSCRGVVDMRLAAAALEASPLRPG